MGVVVGSAAQASAVKALKIRLATLSRCTAA